MMSKIVIPLNSYSQTEIALEAYDQFFKIIRESGAYGVELRRELLSAEPPTFEWIRDRLENDLFIVYSAPLSLWLDNGSFNEEGLDLVFKEARTIKAKWVKLSLGNYNEVSDLVQVKRFLDQQNQMDHRLNLLVENDQTMEGGQIQRFVHFFEQAHALALPIKMTFDIGNWIYTKQDPFEAWEALSPHVGYLHLKQVIQGDSGLETVPLSLDTQQTWLPFVLSLTEESVMALEFPISPLHKTKAYVELVRELRGEFVCHN
jgi:sugar phosphate isomerase/epimerase